MIRVPLIAAGLAIYFGVRFLSGRRRENVIRLRNGRRIKLLSSVALLDRSDRHLLALEYFSELPDPAPEELQLEARSLVRTVGARKEYATCRSALVSVRRPDQRRDDPAPRELVFSFARGDAGSDWHPADG